MMDQEGRCCKDERDFYAQMFTIPAHHKLKVIRIAICTVLSLTYLTSEAIICSGAWYATITGLHVTYCLFKTSPTVYQIL